MIKLLFTNIVILLSFCFLLSPTHSLAGQVTLAWDPPDIAIDVTGYMIHYGTAAGTYTEGVDVSNTTSSSVNNLIEGQTYYFAVTAYNTGGYQSMYSNEVSKEIGLTNPPPQYALLILNPGPGQGIVSGPGINCGDTCLAVYNPDTVVPLSATADSGSTFDGWWGGGCSGTGLCTIRMNANTDVTANFRTNSVISYNVTASVSGRGGTISPAGTSSIISGNSMTFSITPATAYGVANVTVDGISVGAVYNYTLSKITANHTINATFKRKK